MVYGIGIENENSMLRGSGKYTILLVWCLKTDKMPCQNKNIFVSWLRMKHFLILYIGFYHVQTVWICRHTVGNLRMFRKMSQDIFLVTIFGKAKCESMPVSWV